MSQNRPRKGSRGGLGAILEDLGATLAPGRAQNQKKLSWDRDFETHLGALWGQKIDVGRHDFSKTSRHGIRKRFFMVL